MKNPPKLWAVALLAFMPKRAAVKIAAAAKVSLLLMTFFLSLGSVY
ncbi:MAG: hypothetical protein ACI97A_000216 [Planctomycetota bacterium]